MSSSPLKNREICFYLSIEILVTCNVSNVTDFNLVSRTDVWEHGSVMIRLRVKLWWLLVAHVSAHGFWAECPHNTVLVPKVSVICVGKGYFCLEAMSTTWTPEKSHDWVSSSPSYDMPIIGKGRVSPDIWTASKHTTFPLQTLWFDYISYFFFSLWAWQCSCKIFQMIF